ncbi:MAG: VWA domain-containing protein, partial [Xanthobacteraceae bacterium]
TSLHVFNKLWARRVLGQGAIVLLITDGLERDPDDRLAFEIDRLHRSCKRLIWLNPLLRYEQFEPKAKDPDEALAAVGANVADWSGGTRIATSLRAFNKLWARRVLTQGAIVLLITDGLERDPDDRLAFEIDRLHRSCRRLIWLNPLLRFSGFEAKAKGIRTMVPHVDELRPIHNLESIADLVRALSATGGRAGDPKAWLDKVA